MSMVLDSAQLRSLWRVAATEETRDTDTGARSRSQERGGWDPHHPAHSTYQRLACSRQQDDTFISNSNYHMLLHISQHFRFRAGIKFSADF